VLGCRVVMKRDLGTLVGREHDLLVIGGGIAGASAAWEAARRGLRVALVEAGDFGSGASWNSLKTIHGGLRHLQRLDLRGLRESARERSLFLRLAPEVVRPLSFVAPTDGRGLRGPTALRAAVWLSERLTAGRNRGLSPDHEIPPARLLSRQELHERVPGLVATGLSGGLMWTDAQVRSSERLLLGVLHAAAREGAVLANYVEVTGLRREGAAVTGGRAADRVGEGEVEIRARLTLNATGSALRGPLAQAGVASFRVPLLHGMNLVLRRPAPVPCAVGARSGRRYLFLVPWAGCTLLGTAYAPAEGPAPGADGFLDEARRAFPWADLHRRDLALVHRGTVPGQDGNAGLWTRDRLVDHEHADRVSGLLSMVSTKYTTARRLAERAVDVVCSRLPRPASPARPPEGVLERARPLTGTLTEQTRRAVHEEMAWHLDDAVLRRLDLGTRGRPDPAELAAVAQAMAAEHGWDAARQERECDRLRRFYDERT
jgi:glycerol-3-phosphate dehydrogenase